MFLKKLKILKIPNGICFLEIVDNKVIVKNENDGLFVFDQELNFKKNLNILNQLAIYRAYKNDNQLLLYCVENSCLIYVNLQDYRHKIISLAPELFEDITFSKLYIWKNNEIVLTTYKDELFKVSINEGIIEKVTFEQIKHISEKFNVIFLDSSNRPISYYNQKESVVLSDDYDTQILTIFDYQNELEKTILFTLKDTHDFMYQNGNVLLVHEDQLELVTAAGARFIEKMDKPTWIFLRAQFLSDNSSFVTLLKDQSNPEMHELRIYEF
jgi:hypothetical protein